jgi:hypothetical protein
MLWTIFYLYRVAVWSTLLFWFSALRLALFCIYKRVSVLPCDSQCVLTVTHGKVIWRMSQISERAKQWTRKIKYILCCVSENLLCIMRDNLYVTYYDFCTELIESGLSFWKKKYLSFTFYKIVELEILTQRMILFTHMQIRIIGESRILWGGFLIWGDALFHTRRCCALCLRM